MTVESKLDVISETKIKQRFVENFKWTDLKHGKIVSKLLSKLKPISRVKDSSENGQRYIFYNW